jgi:hypothetical protein
VFDPPGHLISNNGTDFALPPLLYFSIFLKAISENISSKIGTGYFRVSVNWIQFLSVLNRNLNEDKKTLLGFFYLLQKGYLLRIYFHLGIILFSSCR